MSNKIDKKVLVEVGFRCDECELVFHNEVIGLDVLNINSENGHVTLNGKLQKTVKRCPLCGKICHVEVGDFDSVSNEEEEDAFDYLNKKFDYSIKKIDDIIEEIKNKPYPHQVPYSPYPPQPWLVGDRSLDPKWSGGSGGTTC